MAGFFRRLFSLGNAEAHSILDKLEDPVKMTEQGIRELKKDLEVAMQNFAEVKAIAIRAERDMEKAKSGSQDWAGREAAACSPPPGASRLRRWRWKPWRSYLLLTQNFAPVIRRRLHR